MSDSTLLAHLSGRLGHGSENLATEALEYVLRNPLVSDAFQRHLRALAPSLPSLARYRIQVGDDGDAGIRDLVGATSDGVTPLVVEVKFDAPLTSNQPGAYMRALAALEVPALLVFLVPTSRAAQLWPRLLRRSDEAGMATTSSGDGMVATSGSVTLAVTTWAAVLDDLSGIPLGEANQQVLAEITQLRGLCAREDREGFMPFGAPFLEGDTGRHLLALDGLLIDAIEVLRGEHLVVTRGFKWSAGQGWFGKYFKLAGVESLLHANFSRWASLADTPLWVRIYPKSDPRVSEALEPLRTSEPRRLFDDDGLQIPVPLPADGDREACLASIVSTLKDVHSLLAELESQDVVGLVQDDSTDEITYEPG
ncbi:MAG: hypothetical protein H0V96_04970 [Acidimicrobiia bacterium]|nr:hypothetical protein [Acidimicrobiia bacterium]